MKPEKQRRPRLRKGEPVKVGGESATVTRDEQPDRPLIVQKPDGSFLSVFACDVSRESPDPQ